MNEREKWYAAYKCLAFLKKEKEEIEQRLKEATDSTDMLYLMNRLKLIRNAITEAEKDEKEKWEELKRSKQ